MKNLLLMAILATGLHATPHTADYKISNDNILEDTFSRHSVYVDWCSNKEVWREYRGYQKGGFVQIMVASENMNGSRPLKCTDYTAWRSR